MKTNENPHYFLGEELLTPNVDKADSGRINMFTNHLSQFLTLNKGERPRVFTRFENQIGKYSSAYKKLNDDITILKIVSRNINNVTYIIEKADNTLDVIEYSTTRNLTESYGYDSQLLVDVEEGDSLPKDTVFFKNSMFDEDLNLLYGKNLKSVYLPYKGSTFEDGIVISESAAKELSHTEVSEMEVMLNTNDVLINIYGDSESYKPFPLINEPITNSVICSRRRVNYNFILDEFKSSNFHSVTPNDQTFFADGIVSDIFIYSNFTEKEKGYSFNKPFVEIEEQQHNYYQELFDFLSSLKEKRSKDFSDDLNYLLQFSKDYLDEELKFSLDNTEFEGVIIKFRIRKECAAFIGSKITGRFGNKGVISMILPDDQMPITADGTERADVVLNNLGVVGRLNPAQNYEQELNFIANQLIKRHKDDHDMLFEEIMAFYEIASPKYYDFLLKTFEEQHDAIDIFVEDIIENGAFIHQPPFFDNISPDQMITMFFDRFNIDKLAFKGIHDHLIIGELFYIKLKHESASKLSIRSAGPVSLLNVPYKNNESYKKGTSLYSNAAIRFGEQETYNMMLLNQPDKVINFIKSYSSSDHSRKNMIKTILRNDIRNIKSVVSPEDTSRSNAAETVRALFAGLGINITTNEEGNFDVDVETSE